MDPWFCVLCQFIIPFGFWEVIYVQVLFFASFPLKFRIIFFLVLFIRAYPDHCLFLACFLKSFSQGYLWVGFLYFLVSQYFVFSLLTCCCCCCFFIFYSCSLSLLFLVLLLPGYSLCFHFVLLSVLPLHPSGPSVFLLCQVNTIPPLLDCAALLCFILVTVVFCILC